MIRMIRMSCMIRTRSIAIVLGTVFWSTPAQAQDWPAFRGPDGDGVSASKQAPLEWDRETNIKWRVGLPQPGNGSPIVSHGRVFVTSAQNDQGTERSLFCFDRKDGKELWVRTVPSPKMPTPSPPRRNWP